MKWLGLLHYECLTDLELSELGSEGVEQVLDIGVFQVVEKEGKLRDFHFVRESGFVISNQVE